MPLQSGQRCCAAIDRIAEKPAAGRQANGKVLAFISCKGGSGATFLATNLGYALATLENKRVLLIDLNLQFGDASLFVSDQKPAGHPVRRGAARSPGSTASFLASCMVERHARLRRAGGAGRPGPCQRRQARAHRQFIKLARRQYDFILLDVGRRLDAVSCARSTMPTSSTRCCRRPCPTSATASAC